MNYRVELADQAKSDLFDIYAWIAQDSRLDAARWIAELETSIRDLEQIPERCPVAPENEAFEEHELRHLIVGRYRVIYTVGDRVVLVLHIRHGSRRTADGSEIADAMRERRDSDQE